MKIIWVLVLVTTALNWPTSKTNPCLEKNKVYETLNLKKNATVCFNTIDSYDLDYKGKDALTIYGKITFPPIKKKKYDAVILSHGSGGIRKYHNNYIQLLNNNGYVVFQIDHYLSRKIKYDKTFSKVSGITFMNDAYKALELLKTHPEINKIAYIGWSQGGVGPILSHFSFVSDFINNGKHIFDASIAIYPYCGFTFPKDSITQTPLLILTGKDDDLTPEAACINLFDKFSKNKKIKHISLENARHGYDNPFLYFGMTFDNLPSLHIISNDCTLTISESGKIMTLSGKLIHGPKESSAILDECSTKGVKVKYNSKAREDTNEYILDFLKENLK